MSIGHETILTPAHIDAIDAFDIISVRDHHTFNAISRISPELATRVIMAHDPTFAIDFYPKATAKSGFAWLDQKGKPTIVSEPLNPLEWFTKVSSLSRAKTYRYHGIIACLLGNTPVKIHRGRRPKVREIVKKFHLGWRWPERDAIESAISAIRKNHRELRDRIRAL